MKKQLIMTRSFILLLLTALWLTACVKDDFDEPPASSLPFDANKVLTIDSLKQIYQQFGDTTFGDIYSVFAVVVMDDRNGNIYKSAYVQDATAGIDLYLNSSGGLYQGDSIRIMLKGATVSAYNNLIQIQDLDVDLNIVKLETGVDIDPIPVTISELVADPDKYQSKLVKLDLVQFVVNELGQSWADPVGLESVNHLLEDCSGKTAIVRSSGYATFAGMTIPSGRGPMIAIASQFQQDAQLIVRSLSELNMTGERCSGSGTSVTTITEDFETQTSDVDITIEGWLNIAEVGSRLWRGKEFGGNIYAQATAYNSFDPDNICWLITPPIDFDANSNEILTFESAMAYWEHDGLEVLISTDFNGSNLTSATWTPLNCTLAGQGSTNYDFVPSGDIDLSAVTGTGYIAFKYTGSGPGGNTTSYMIDNVMLFDSKTNKNLLQGLKNR